MTCSDVVQFPSEEPVPETESASSECEVDEDCEETHWCRGSETKECRAYVVEGESCNGNLHSDFHELCADRLECVYPEGLLGASGECTVAQSQVHERCFNPDGSAKECYIHDCWQTNGTKFYCEQNPGLKPEQCTDTCVVGEAKCYWHLCEEHPPGLPATNKTFLCLQEPST